IRMWDARTANGVDHFIANSNFIANRIWKTYRRKADVIYPPVDTTRFIPYTQKEDYYLAASRLVPYKKIDLIVESFAKMPDKKLIVIGDGPDFRKIKTKAEKNVKNIEILGYQPTEKLIHYLQRAKAFVFAAEEDFGLMPLEAQACGTPVIAFGKGGALETVRGLDHEKPTGLFFSEQSMTAIINAVKLLEEKYSAFTPDAFKENVSRFTSDIFREKLTRFVATRE
ncbi:MAG TPA: glycosyltransferase, partial [Gammaproteobacteria bacterium]|nr:glycosyltransferase [Gammaproteobacteria bacterium]